MYFYLIEKVTNSVGKLICINSNFISAIGKGFAQVNTWFAQLKIYTFVCKVEYWFALVENSFAQVEYWCSQVQKRFS